MSDRPSISVVVPFHNSERHITRCLESLEAQRDVEGGFEILAVDNRSDDRSASIAAGYPRVTLLEEPTPGAYAARNLAIRQARAPIVALTDADCEPAPDWLRSIEAGMRDPQTAVLLGRVDYPEGCSLPLRWLGAYENAKTDFVLRRCEPAYWYAYANNMAVRAALFEELGPFEEWQRAADSELVHRLAAHRPDLRVLYRPEMRVTHLEFERGRARAERLRLYRRTNSKIASFRELGLGRRLAVVMHLALGRPAKEEGTGADRSLARIL